jgi:hypothetical protein
MDKQELINKINHTLLDKDTIATDTHHPFHNFSIEEMQEAMDSFTNLDKKWAEKPSSLIYSITSYLATMHLISFELEEKQNTDEAWFEALIYENIGLKGEQEINKTIIWDGSFYIVCEDFDEFIELLAETQADIDSVTLFNSIKE